MGFIGMIPLILMTTVFMLQVILFGYTLVVAESAVRDAARAAATGRSPQNAVDRVSQATGIPITVTAQPCDKNTGLVQVDVYAETPALIKAIQQYVIHRWAVMQYEGHC